MVATSVLSAAPQQHGRAPAHQVVTKKKVVVTRQNYRSNWRKGERFDSRQARNYRQIDYRKYRGLKAPPRGYRYVQSGNDAVLVGITSGIIAAVITGAIR
ncbi:MAG TPA: RcnB family protein [Sphingomonas sp.]|nr:RcnB family protein [Sphingomonas sp.]